MTKNSTPAARTVSATWNGQTVTRTSNRAYAFASVVRWSNGTEEVASFHASEIAALKGVLTAQQKQNGAQVIAAIRTNSAAAPVALTNAVAVTKIGFSDSVRSDTYTLNYAR